MVEKMQNLLVAPEDFQNWLKELKANAEKNWNRKKQREKAPIESKLLKCG